MKAQLHDHQREAVAKMHNGCVLHGDVGTGKTITALGYALEKEPYKKIVIVTTAKVRDSLAWEREAAKLMIPVENIEVTSWNKINSLVDYEGKFFIFDEQRLVGSGAWVKAFQKIARKNHWILLSATPGDTWSDYAPMFIANGWYKNITEFRREHAIYSRYTNFPKIERWINEGKLQKYRKRLLVKMPMERHTTKHHHYVECEYDKELLDIVRKKRWNVYEDSPILNAAELFGVMRKVVSSDPDRLSQMENLVRIHPRLIVFYNYNYELDILRQMCERLEKDPSGLYSPGSKLSTMDHILDSMRVQNPQAHKDFLESLPPWTLTDEEMLTALTDKVGPNTTATRKHTSPEERTESWESKTLRISSPATDSFGWAEWNGHKHEEIPDTDRWVYLVQYASGSEGWNCIETDAMAFWSLTYSWKQFWQAQGRIDRLNTPYSDLHYYILMTNSPAEKPVLMSLEQKKDFQPR